MSRKSNKIFKNTSYWYEGDEDILFIKYSPKLHITLAVARELVNSRLEYTNNKPHYTVIDFTNVIKVNKEAREFMNSDDYGLKNILGGAFLSNSIIGVFFVNLYIKVNKPKVPAKFFTSKDSAMDWLKKLKAQAKSE